MEKKLISTLTRSGEHGSNGPGVACHVGETRGYTEQSGIALRSLGGAIAPDTLPKARPSNRPHHRGSLQDARKEARVGPAVQVAAHDWPVAPNAHE
ncbi:hypothetical protein NL676_013212 [Syzygium grande]|nr:hypothetical protein NL676_013212 [Syzygium grande]